MDNTNPYEPPQAVDPDVVSPSDSGNPKRPAARQAVRKSLLILLIPGVVNLLLYHSTGWIAGLSAGLRSQIFLGNSLGLIVLSLAVWFAGLQIFEFVTGGLFTVFAKRSSLNQWCAVLYRALAGRAAKLALCGAIAWSVWLICIHVLGLPFMLVSVPVGGAAHLFGAAFYIPLFRDWYRLETSPALRSET